MATQTTSAPASLDALFNKVGKGWANTPAAEPMSDLPAGNYTATLGDCKVFVTKKGELAIQFPLVVLSGKAKGKKTTKFARLTTEKNISYAKADLASLGIDPEDIDPSNFKKSLSPMLAALAGQAVEIKVDNTEYHNIYFVGLVSPDDSDGDVLDFADDDEGSDE